MDKNVQKTKLVSIMWKKHLLVSHKTQGNLLFKSWLKATSIRRTGIYHHYEPHHTSVNLSTLWYSWPHVVYS